MRRIQNPVKYPINTTEVFILCKKVMGPRGPGAVNLGIAFY